jgi:hypothetical protein
MRPASAPQPCSLYPCDWAGHSRPHQSTQNPRFFEGTGVTKEAAAIQWVAVSIKM